MNKLTSKEEREYNHLKRQLFDQKSFIEMDFVSNQLLLNRYNELANKRAKNILKQIC